MSNRLAWRPAQYLPSIRTFVRAFAAYAGAKGSVAAALVLLGAVLESFGLVLLIPLLGLVFGGGASDDWFHRQVNFLFGVAGADTPLARLMLILAVFACLLAIRAVVLSNRNVLLSELELGFVAAEKSRVATLLAGASWERVAGLKHARVTHVMGGDLDMVGTAAYFLLQAATAIVVLAAQLALSFLLAPVLAILAFALLGIGLLAATPLVRRARAMGEYLADAHLALFDTTAQFLGGLKLAMSQNLQPRFEREFRDTLDALVRRQTDYVRKQTNRQLAFATLAALVAGIVVLLGFAVFHIAPAILITLLVVLVRINGPTGQLQQGVQQLVHALPAYEKVKALEAELETTATVAPGHDDFDGEISGDIVFDNVSFDHAESGRGVAFVGLTIRPGECLGITGPSGAGKTTFADLLVGLYAPQAGGITAGGKPLAGSLLAVWRESLSYVSQDPFLFHGTVRRNLSWANPEATEAEMWATLRLCGAEGLVRDMEHGLDTIVGERGTLVSGGERQRIALARAVLRKPKLLVLDEATSAVDIGGERTIMENLLAFRPRFTMIMIAHRRESLALCDRVLRFEAGRVDDMALRGPTDVKLVDAS